jgi:hypothetical protein
MIPLSTLDHLISQRLKDAHALLKAGRNGAAVYLMGYALELALKRKICRLWNFTGGFPETSAELRAYLAMMHPSPILGITLTNIRDIRNHDLSTLLRYSGAEYHIKNNFLVEWNSAVVWYVEMRYAKTRFSADKTTTLLRHTRTIINEIF